MAYPAEPSYPAIGGASSGGGGGSVDPVEPPSPTSQNVASGASLSAVTFGSFTDSGNRIASYVSAVTNANGSTSFSGSGLGAYTASGEADGSAGTLSLTARDASGDDLATAVHTFRRAIPAGEGWVSKLDLDVTAMTPTSLSAGSNTVDGRVIECDAAESVGGGNGLSASATNDVLMEISDAWSGSQDKARMVIMKVTMPGGWGGSSTGHAVRARLYSGGLSALGASPSCQTRYYPQSTNMRLQGQYQHRAPSGTGSFTSSSSYDHANESSTTTWYNRIVMLRGTYYVSIHKTLAAAIPSDLDAVMDTSADTIVCGITSYTSIGTSSFFPSQMYVGLYNQNANSLGVLERVICYLFE